jgi:hypothetical protein
MKQTAVDWLESLYDSRPAYEEYISPEEFEHVVKLKMKHFEDLIETLGADISRN